MQKESKWSAESHAWLVNSAEALLTAVNQQARKDLPDDVRLHTSERFAKFMEHILEGECYSNEEIAAMFNKTFVVSNNAMVVEANIPIFSMCEHHLALMYDMKCHIGYIPKGRVIGLSKLPRIAQMCAHRLQLQERIGQDIFEVLEMILHTPDIIVVIEGKHSCVTARGIEAREAVTRTAFFLPETKFAEERVRQEFYSLCH